MALFEDVALPVVPDQDPLSERGASQRRMLLERSQDAQLAGFIFKRAPCRLDGLVMREAKTRHPQG